MRLISAWIPHFPAFFLHNFCIFFHLRRPQNPPLAFPLANGVLLGWFFWCFVVIACVLADSQILWLKNAVFWPPFCTPGPPKGGFRGTPGGPRGHKRGGHKKKHNTFFNQNNCLRWGFKRSLTRTLIPVDDSVWPQIKNQPHIFLARGIFPDKLWRQNLLLKGKFSHLIFFLFVIAWLGAAAMEVDEAPPIAIPAAASPVDDEVRRSSFCLNKCWWVRVGDGWGWGGG